MIGQTISHYKILQKLGEGGMGAVYLAEDTSLGRKVAVKFLSSDKAADPEFRRRFIHEAKSQAQVSHANITSFHEVGEEGDRVFIVMEYIEGQPLSRLTSGEKLSLPEILDLAIQIGEGLSAAHERGVMHRDINPNNILVTSKQVVKITDFGLAKWKGASTITRTGLQMGTDSYMSPEQLEGKKADFRTDIFSFGVVLYEFICSHRPFEGNNREALFYEILYTQPQPLARFCRGIPEGLERLVMKCLAKKPEERYQSAADLVADLRTLKRTSEIGILPTKLEKRKAKKWRNVMLATAGLSLIAILGFLLLTGRGEAIDSVAVLPFVNASADSSLEYLSDGLTENLIFNLSRLPKLKVIARASAFIYKGRDIDVQEVGKKLNVRAVLTGRMVPRGERLSISVELMDARQNTSIWGERYERGFSDISALQEEISKEIADKLRLKLTLEKKKQLTKRYTVNPEAYDLYLQGEFQRQKGTLVGRKKAEEYFNRAIKKDPNYALAYVGLAHSYTSGTGLSSEEVNKKIKTAVMRAVEIDDGLAEAHTTLAMFLQEVEWDWAGAEEEFKRAIELNPGYAEAHHQYSHYLMNMGRTEESVLEGRKALALDTLSIGMNVHSGWTFLYSRQYDRAIEKLQETAQMDPNLFWSYWFLGEAYVGKGMYAEAVKEFLKAGELDVGNSGTKAMLGYCYARTGRRPEAIRILEDLKGLQEQNKALAIDLAVICAGLGEKNLALDWLERAVAERESYVVELKVEPIFDGLRAEPRFAELLKKVGLEI